MMKILGNIRGNLTGPTLGARHVGRQIKDYASVGQALLWQRLLMIIGALLLVGFYYSAAVALACGTMISASELLDAYLFKKISRWNGQGVSEVRRFMKVIYLSTIISAGAIVTVSISTAWLQGHTTHFMPLFLLFAAALFAGMHNHQLLPILAIRLAMYTAAFLFIPIHDLWVVRPPLTSGLWLQFFTSIFVLFFILDSSRIYMKMYRESQRQNDALALENEHSKRALKAKSEFLSVVSHELRTPLSSIKGSLDLIAAGTLGPVPETMTRVFEIARNNSQRLATLINDLLDFQKIEAGKLDYFFSEVSTRELVGKVVRDMQPYADQYGVSVELRRPDENFMVRADPRRLEQVLANLLSNAAKFSYPDGRIGVGIERVGKRVRISVADQGVGLPNGTRERIFEPFSQLDSSAKRKASGTGLGLSISNRIVEAHGGLLDFQRHDGPGTTFFVELDLLPA